MLREPSSAWHGTGTHAEIEAWFHLRHQFILRLASMEWIIGILWPAQVVNFSKFRSLVHAGGGSALFDWIMYLGAYFSTSIS